jgi:hypothetical protein
MDVDAERGKAPNRLDLGCVGPGDSHQGHSVTLRQPSELRLQQHWDRSGRGRIGRHRRQ